MGWFKYATFDLYIIKMRVKYFPVNIYRKQKKGV